MSNRIIIIQQVTYKTETRGSRKSLFEKLITAIRIIKELRFEYITIIREDFVRNKS